MPTTSVGCSTLATAHVKPARRRANHHERWLLSSHREQVMQIGSNPCRRFNVWPRFAPSRARSIIRTDSLVTGDSGWTRARSIANELAPASRMTVGVPLPVQFQTQPSAADVDQSARRGPISIGCGGTAYGQHQSRKCGVTLLHGFYYETRTDQPIRVRNTARGRSHLSHLAREGLGGVIFAPPALSPRTLDGIRDSAREITPSRLSPLFSIEAPPASPRVRKLFDYYVPITVINV